MGILLTTTLAYAGGYVDGNVVFNPAKAINTGAVSITPTFNNDQFNVTREQDALGRTVDMSYGPLDQVATTKDKRGNEHVSIMGVNGCIIGLCSDLTRSR
ncbi:MAG: hypothetical protein M3A44_02590 [Gammaproteobacteria bacterium]